MADPDRLARALVDAAIELHRRRLWLELPVDAPIAVRVPDQPHLLAATIIGHGASDYGIFVVRGEHALREFEEFCGTHERPIDELELVGFNMDPLGEIQPQMRRVLDAARVQARREALVPGFYAKDRSSRTLRVPTRAEQRLLLSVIRAVLLARDANQLQLDSPNNLSARVLELTLEEADGRSRVVARSLPWKRSARKVDDLAIKIPAQVSRLDATWVIGVVFDERKLPAEFEATEFVAIIEESTGRVINQCLRAPGEFDETVEMIEGAVRGASGEGPGLPREVIFTDDELFENLGPEFDRHGVRARAVESHPAIVDYAAACTGALADIARQAERERRSARMPTTLDGWKEADMRFARRFSARLDAENKSLGRALARFFGSEQVGAEVLQELAHYPSFASFCEWRMADYRPTAKSKTFLERALLDRTTTDVDRALIDARRNARISIYRVDAAVAGESLEVEDIFDGTRFTVQERALSSCAVVGHSFPMRVMKVGDWHFVALAGPPLPPLYIDNALRRLEALGVPLSAEGLTKMPHTLGRLWELALPRNWIQPRMANTDGDPLVFHKATFRLADVKAFEAALGRRSDVEFDESTGDWTWTRTSGPSPELGAITLLGRIRILDTTALLEVNSAARYRKARAWIERLPGVTFEHVSSTALADLTSELDDRLPSDAQPSDPEVIGRVKAELERFSMRWIDERVPALGNRTPREVCKTEAGRRRVAAMIRTMPATASPHGPIEPPRDAMLRALGLMIDA